MIKKPSKLFNRKPYNDINEIFGHIDDDIEESLKILMKHQIIKQRN